MDWFSPDESKTKDKSKTKIVKEFRNPRVQLGVQPEWLKPYSLTKESSQIFHQRRRELMAEQVEAGIVEGVNDSLEVYEKTGKITIPRVKNAGEARRRIIRKIVKGVMESKSLKSISDVMSYVDGAAGYKEEKGNNGSSEQTISPEIEQAQRMLYQIIINVEQGKDPKVADILDAVTRETDATDNSGTD
jgi:hypothetical protein